MDAKKIEAKEVVSASKKLGRKDAVALIKGAETVPWCITLDNSKGISRLRFWAKNRRVNGINDLPVFMHQGRAGWTFLVTGLARRPSGINGRIRCDPLPLQTVGKKSHARLSFWN